MEAVLKVRVQGISMPWKEVMRGCLVTVMFGILCLCVQNYAEKGRTVQDVPACSTVVYGTAKAWEEADLSEICRAGKPAATDMRGTMTDFPGDLSGAVKPVPVRKVRAKNLSGADITGGWTVKGRTETLPAVPGMNPAEIEKPEIVVREDPPVMDVPDIPGNYVIPGGSGTTGDRVIPGESVVPGDPVIPGGSVAPGEPVTPGGSVAPGDSVTPGGSEIPGDNVVPGESIIPGEPDISEEPDVPGEIAGFILDEQGYITGYTDRVMLSDGLLLIPKGEGCIGIRGGAFDGMSEEIWEVYIPATVCDIEPGVFDGFPCLMFVEVSEKNPCYYSEDGILYSASGEEIFCPVGRLTE